MAPPSGGTRPSPEGHEQGLSWILKLVSLRVYVKSGDDVDLLRCYVASFLMFVGLFSKFEVRELKFNKKV